MSATHNYCYQKYDDFKNLQEIVFIIRLSNINYLQIVNHYISGHILIINLNNAGN